MADFQAAFDYVIDDEGRSGNVTSDPVDDDQHAVARFGINSHWYPGAVADGFYTMPVDQALSYAAQFYKLRYFAAIGGYSIVVQEIANKYFDLAVNEGTAQATKIIQRACNQALSSVAGFFPLLIDGKSGANTINAINECNPEDLLPAIKVFAAQFYKEVADRLHWSSRELAALLARVDR